MPRPRSHRLATGLSVGVVSVLALAACTPDTSSSDDANATGSGSGSGSNGAPSSQATPKPDPFQATLRVPGGVQQVAVDKPVAVTATSGTLERVVVYHGRRTAENTLPGRLSADRTSWSLRGTLEPGLTYTVLSTGRNEDGERRTIRDRFSTDALTLDEQTYPSVAPLQGETVGVGMPVIVTFDVPVTNRASIEKHLSVESEPQMAGTWHWMSDTEVHYRPRHFWPAGAEVDVDVDINSVNAGNGIYGQESRHVSFDVGDSVVSNINVATHQMRVEVNGKLARTVPISAGKAGFETRDGTKLIIEKFLTKRMDAATTGISPGDPEYYNIPDVQYAMRVTYSGEFLHAAPWSVGSQGAANVSHGCVGMSTENAAWLYNISHRGDVVHVVGSGRSLENGNGWTDWNMSWADYKAGSALT